MNTQTFLTEKALEAKQKFLLLSPAKQREFLDVSAPRIIEQGKKTGCSAGVIDYLIVLADWLEQLHNKPEVKK